MKKISSLLARMLSAFAAMTVGQAGAVPQSGATAGHSAARAGEPGTIVISQEARKQIGEEAKKPGSPATKKVNPPNVAGPKVTNPGTPRSGVNFVESPHRESFVEDAPPFVQDSPGKNRVTNPAGNVKGTFQKNQVKQKKSE